MTATTTISATTTIAAKQTSKASTIAVKAPARAANRKTGPQNTAVRAARDTKLAKRAALGGRVLIDLSATGVAPSTVAEVFDRQKTDLKKVARIATAAYDAGTDLVLLGPAFRLASGRKHATDGWLDPAVAVRRLGAVAKSAGVSPALAVSAKDVPAAVSLAGVARESGWAALDVRAAVDPFGVDDADETTADMVPAVAAGLGTGENRPLLIAHATTPVQAHVAGLHADILRVHAKTPAGAAKLRAIALKAAAVAGRDADALRVLVEVRVVLSQDAAAARERVYLLDALAAPAASDEYRPLDAIGSVAEVAQLLNDWVTDGVCDGAVLIPGSLQTDTAVTLQYLLPALAEQEAFLA